MQNREDEIEKNGIFTRRGYGGKRKSKTTIDESGLFRKMNKNKKRIDERWQTWRDYAKQLKETLSEVHRRMCAKVFDDMLAYFVETNELLDVERDLERVQLLPVACLNTGVNLPDHDTTFSLLAQKIKKSSLSPHIVRLSALNSASVKHAFSAIADQLGMPDRSDVTIWNIEKFIAEKEIAELAPPIVIIFEDSEAFNPSVFSQLLEMMSAAQSSLKLIIVLGIATDSSMINDVLPYEALSLLDMKHFSCLSAPKYLQEFLNLQLMTPNSLFQLSSHSFEFLLIQFLNYDFSVSNFASGILFASMEHYRDQAMSFLCTDKETGLDRIKSMDEKEINEINQLPSMANNQVDRAQLVELYECHFEEEEIVHIFLKAFHASQAHLIEHPFGKRPRQNYILSLENKLIDTSEFRKYITYLSLLDEEKFNLVVADFKNAFDAKPDFRFTKYLEEVTCRLMAEDLSELAEGAGTDDREDEDDKKAKNAYELQKQLRSKANSRSRPKTKYQHLRNQFCEFLTTVCQDYFYTGRQSKPLAEVFHYTNRKKLKDVFNPSLTKILQRAMVAPHHYLDIKKAESVDSISADQPDISVAYKLFTQSGNMINLADWMDSFMAVKENKKTETIELEARFMQCANDLQFIGLLKPTQRKTDHVQKCTWAL